MAKVILQCRPSSHQFPDREILATEPIKIGRAVANCKPGNDNGYFNCKVLSRNHALLWYENGKFYLQDTQSSNGTFVNNQKLPGSSVAPLSSSSSSSSSSQGTLKSDESNIEARREIFSGDVVQFGVDVVETSKKGQQPVTHGCIIASLRLFHPDGSEAKSSVSKFSLITSQHDGRSADQMVDAPKLSVQEIYELQSVLQEAHHREVVLESKLASLNKILTAMERKDSWTATFQEDMLLSKIQFLQAQVHSYEKQLQNKSGSLPGRPTIANAHSADEKMINEIVNKPSSNGVDLDGLSLECAVSSENDAFLGKIRDTNIISDDFKLSLLTDWNNMLKERANFETIAKDTLQQALAEKLEASKALAIAEERLSVVQNQCDDLHNVCQHTQKDLMDLVQKFQQQSQDLENLTQTYQESERVKIECLEALTMEKSALEEYIKELRQQLSERSDMYDDLVVRNEKLERKISAMKVKSPSKPNNYDRVTGDLIVNNGYLDDSDKEGFDFHVGDLQQQPVPGNILQGKDVAQVVRELGMLMTEEERVRQTTFPSSQFMMKEESFETKHADENEWNKQSIGIGEFLSVNESLAELVKRLQAELFTEREKNAAFQSSPNQNEVATSTEDLVEPDSSFSDSDRIPVTNPSPYKRSVESSALSDALDELNVSLTAVQTSAEALVSPSIFAMFKRQDPVAIVALLFITVWMTFFVFNQ